MAPAVELAPGAFRGRRFALALALLVVIGLAVRPSVFALGFAADDYAQLGMMRGLYPIERHPLDLFTFSDGSPEESEVLRQQGFYPWFAHPGLRLSMFRPLASALMWVDHGLFDLWAPGYHLHSLLWWIGMLAALLWLLRELVPPRLVLLVGLLFVVDETHGVMLGWIANRNAILSAGLGFVALGAHLARREQVGRFGGWVVATAFSLSLLGGEYALCLLAYFAAYELLAAPGPWRERTRALLPVAVPSALYVAARTLGGYGSAGSGLYVDPLGETGAFLREALHRYPILVGDLTLAVRADWWTFGLPWSHELLRRGWVDGDFVLAPEPWRRWHEAIGGVALVLAAALGHAAARWAPPAQARHLRWVAAGAALSLIPLLASFPASRSLVVPLFGWSLLIGAFAYHGFARGGLPRVLAVVVLAFHLVAPAVHTWQETRGMAWTSDRVRDTILTLEVDDAKLPGQRVVLMSALEPTTTAYISLIRGVFGRTVPRSVWVMNPSAFPYTLRRAGPGRVFAELHAGTMLSVAFQTMFRTPDAPVRRFQKFELDGLSVRVLELRDGAPYKVRFDFDPPLDDPSWVFLHPTAYGLQRFPMPSVGGEVQVPSPMPYASFGRR